MRQAKKPAPKVFSPTGGMLMFSGVIPSEVYAMVGVGTFGTLVVYKGTAPPPAPPPEPMTPDIPPAGRAVFKGYVNGKEFNCQRRGGQPYALGGRCFACRLDFTHRGMGLPIKMRQTATDVVVTAIDTVCCFQCALAHSIAIAHQPEEHYMSLTVESHHLVHTLYYMQYGDAVDLEPPPSYRLLAANGADGGLTPAEYFGPHAGYRFRALPNVQVNAARTPFVEAPL